MSLKAQAVPAQKVEMSGRDPLGLSLIVYECVNAYISVYVNIHTHRHTYLYIHMYIYNIHICVHIRVFILIGALSYIQAKCIFWIQYHTIDS